MGDNSEGPIKSVQAENFEKKFGIFPKISKVSKNIFWASCDHAVARNRFFRKKSPKKLRTQGTPPV